MVNNQTWYKKKVDECTRQIEGLIDKRNYYLLKVEEMRVNHNLYQHSRKIDERSKK